VGVDKTHLQHKPIQSYRVNTTRQQNVQTGHETMEPAALRLSDGTKEKRGRAMTHWRALPHIACELLAGNDGDGKDFAVCDFGLWVVALVEYVEQVVEDAESRDVFVQHG
jgi:hypothetical protein